MLALEVGEFRFNTFTGKWALIISFDDVWTIYLLDNSRVKHRRSANINWHWSSKDIWEIIK